MSILTIGAAGITAVLLAVWLKGVRAEYALYMVLGAQILFMICGTGRLEVILDAMRRLEGYIKIDPAYLGALLKMVGITYVAEFASGICKDAGYSSIAGQIELFARLAVLAVSMPVLLALLETVHDFL